jgi:AcrR family transcriptional regulator
MARRIGSHGPTTMAAIREAGLQLIYTRGYEAMSLRQLAAEVGLQVGSLYNHIRTKQDLLFDLVKTHMETLAERLDQAIGHPGDPVARLRDFVAFHVTYHIERKREVFICFSELRSLEPANYAIIVDMRRAYERRLVDILDQGVAARAFAVADTQVAAYGILSMLTGVCTWFRPDGRMSIDDVARVYTVMVLNGIAARRNTAAPALWSAESRAE